MEFKTVKNSEVREILKDDMKRVFAKIRINAIFGACTQKRSSFLRGSLYFPAYSKQSAGHKVIYWDTDSVKYER